MTSETDYSNRCIPSLVQLCQRVAIAHVDSITSFGDELRYPIVKPILERCNSDQLVRLEQASPHLQRDTPEIWQDLCFRKYPTAVERYPSNDSQEPESWKDRYFMLQEAEAKRLEAVGSKLRSQRLEADERKKEREIKITNRVPPPKRTKTNTWSESAQRKSLFQKTRTEAAKRQKTMYNARILPPMPTGRNYRVLTQSPDATFPSIPPLGQSSRVTVNTVVHRRSAPVSTPSSTVLSSFGRIPSAASSPPSSTRPLVSSTPTAGSPSSRAGSSPNPPHSSLPRPTSIPDPRPLKSPSAVKRDPMASLFVPKHRAYSQRPV